MSAAKERPILFSGPMVRALLAGRKTQTRRVVKQQPPAVAVDAGHLISGDPKTNGLWWWLDSTDLMDASTVGDEFRCPYGVPGDRLWVKETHATPNDQVVIYRANWREDALARGMDNVPVDDSAIRWRPSIHMPRWASRLTLAITDVRVERLQDISVADAVTEGCDPVHMQPGGPTGDPGEGWLDYREGYRALWNAINGPDSWDANPWVWALTFEVVS